ncbi:MAG: hypothetical protein AB1304_06105 [Bacteroidota bacterium]
MCACYFEINSSDAIAVFAAILAVESAFLFFIIPTVNDTTQRISEASSQLFNLLYKGERLIISVLFFILFIELIIFILLVLNLSNIHIRNVLIFFELLLFVLFIAFASIITSFLLKFIFQNPEKVLDKDIRGYTKKLLDELEELENRTLNEIKETNDDEQLFDKLFFYE